MTLKLARSRKNIEAKTSPAYDEVRFIFQTGALAIELEDFCDLALYVLTNTDLKANDPRLAFMRKLAELSVGDGYNPGGKRLRGHEVI
jgi:hypothetical protein